MRERGSAMLMAVISVMLLFLIAGISFSFVINRYRTETSEEKILKAYVLAESGINSEIAHILKTIDDNKNSIDYNLPDPYGGLRTMLTDPNDWMKNDSNVSDANGKFEIIRVTFDQAFTTVTVTSKGTYRNVQRTIVQQYAIAGELN